MPLLFMTFLASNTSLLFHLLMSTDKIPSFDKGNPDVQCMYNIDNTQSQLRHKLRFYRTFCRYFVYILSRQVDMNLSSKLQTMTYCSLLKCCLCIFCTMTRLNVSTSK